MSSKHTVAPETARRPTIEDALDVYFAGYLINQKQLRVLCLNAYGYSEEDLKQSSAADLAAIHFSNNGVIDSPSLVPVYPKNNIYPEDYCEEFVLIGRVAFARRGRKRPILPFDEKAKEYLDHWVPPHLLDLEEMKGVVYVWSGWPRGEPCR